MGLITPDHSPTVVVDAEVCERLEKRRPLPGPGATRIIRGGPYDRLLKKGMFEKFPAKPNLASPELMRQTRLYLRGIKN